MPRRAERTSSDSAARILDAALEIAARRGYDGTSISQISAAVELPASSLYWHFGNKDALLGAALVRGWEKLQPALAGTPLDPDGVAVEPDRRTWEDFDGAVRVWFQQVAGIAALQPQFWLFGLMLVLEDRPEELVPLAAFRSIHAEAQRRIEAWFLAVLPADSAEPGRAAMLADLCVMLVEGAMGERLARPAVDAERVLHSAVPGFLAVARDWTAA